MNNIDPTGHWSLPTNALGWAAVGLTAAAIITGDQNLGMAAGAMGLFIAVKDLRQWIKEHEAKAKAAKNNKPIKDPVKTAEQSGGGGDETTTGTTTTDNTNTGSGETVSANDIRKKAIMDETGALFEKLKTLQPGTQEYREVLNQIQSNLDLIDIINGNIPASMRDAKLNTEIPWPTGSDFIMPTRIKKLNQVYGDRIQPCPGATIHHMGWDLGNDLNTEVLASAGGEIIYIGEIGNALVITIDHGNGLQTHYWHLNKFADIKLHDIVGQGTVIGYMGSTGVGTGVHLHFAISRGKLADGSNWNYIDPADFLTFDAGLLTADDVYYENGRYHNKLPKKK